MRSNIPKTLVDLIDHSFSQMILKESMEIKNELFDDHMKIDAEPKRSLTIVENYKLDVGFHLSQLFSWCQQIVNIVHFLAAKTPNAILKKHSITSYDLVIYHIENYYIRVQSLYDRLLNLTNSLLLLGNLPDNITHKLIVENRFTKQSKLDIPLKKINRLIRNYLGAKRNMIVHRQGYQDDNLRELEYYCLFIDGIQIPYDDQAAMKYVKSKVKELSKKVASTSTTEFIDFNDKVFLETSSLFSTCENVYKKRVVSLL